MTTSVLTGSPASPVQPLPLAGERDPLRPAGVGEEEAVDQRVGVQVGQVGGYLSVVGRSKDMVIRGGENVYPREIEEFLYRHPAIADVQVFGVPDPKFGEELCAWVKLREGETLTEEEVRDFCRGQIAHYKIPRYVRFVPDFPMTVTGKMQKFIMRETMLKELST